MNKGIDIDHIDFYNVDVASAFEIFKIVSQIVTDLNILERIVREIVADYAKQNCIYLELRSTPKVFKDSTLEDYINKILNAIEEASTDKIRVRYIASINR